MRRIGSLLAAACITYAAAVILWQAVRLAAGDRWWWLALANTLSLYLLAPSILAWPLALLSRRRAAAIGATAPLILLLLFYGGLYVPQAGAGRAEEGARLRVMAANVLYLTDDGAALEPLIRAESPDLICLQEVNPRLAQDLVARLGQEYPYYALLPEEGTSGLGLFSRYPLDDVGEVPDPAWTHGAQTATITLAGQSVLVLNVHARPMILPFSGADVRDMERSYRQREEEARLWRDRVAQHPGPVIVAGDLNATDQNLSYRLLAADLQDAHRQAGWGPGHTWQAYGQWLGAIPFPARLWRVDYVLASEEWQVVSSRVGSRPGRADHLPVVADLIVGQDLALPQE
jgi:endonuclease/exonuclease/phosphatase (EEP) superfamily protein YafD